MAGIGIYLALYVSHVFACIMYISNDWKTNTAVQQKQPQ